MAISSLCRLVPLSCGDGFDRVFTGDDGSSDYEYVRSKFDLNDIGSASIAHALGKR